MLDIILNSKLRAAVDAGIQIEFTQIQALEKLPLSDAEPCSLIMNIIDNAVNAASMAKQRYIRVSSIFKTLSFMFTC